MDAQRRCARGPWCRNYELVPGADASPERAGAYCYRAFCEPAKPGAPSCRADIEDALEALPGYWLLLEAEIGTPAVDGLHLRVPFGPRIPLRLDIDAQLRAMTEILASWEERVRDTARLAVLDTFLSRHRRGGVAVVQSARILRAQLDVLLALAEGPMIRSQGGKAGICMLGGDGAGLEILHLHYLARSVLGETRPPPEQLSGITCRSARCDLRNTLYRAPPPAYEGAPEWWSACAACGDRMTEEEYRAWVRRCAAFETARLQHVPVLENLPALAN